MACDGKLGPVLLEIRRRAGLTQDDVADRMGLTGKGRRNLVSRLEKGKTPNPRLVTVLRFIRACGGKGEAFCDLYDPPAVPEVDTSEIDRTSFLESDKKQLKHRLRMEVYKYNSRTTRWVKGTPMAPAVQKLARTRFESYRSQANIIELAAKRMLDYEAFPKTDYVGYLLLARRVLSLLRRGKRPERLEDMPTVMKLVKQWRLDSRVAEKLRKVVVEQYVKLLNQS